MQGNLDICKYRKQTDSVEINIIKSEIGGIFIRIKIYFMYEQRQNECVLKTY